MSDKLKPCPYCNGQAEMGYGDACYFVYCTHCNTCGAGEVDSGADAEEQAAEAWNALPRRPQWTTEPPTEPGWYWQRRDKEDTPLPVRVEDISDLPANAQWAGPIPEPQEKK